MSELRQDPTTKEWVIIAPERAKRPDQFYSEAGQRLQLPAFDPSCPFCPGNEASTPPEVFVEGNCAAGKSGWQVRVVPNKFPALTPEGAAKRHTEAGFFHKMGRIWISRDYCRDAGA